MREEIQEGNDKREENTKQVGDEIDVKSKEGDKEERRKDCMRSEDRQKR